MIQVIEDLRERKQKLTSTFKRQKKEYRTKVNRIDRAITNFERGLQELGVGEFRVPTTADFVETILRENRKPMHLKAIVAELNRRRDVLSPYQSVSRLMQMYSKNSRRFKRVAPATFALVQSK